MYLFFLSGQQATRHTDRHKQEMSIYYRTVKKIFMLKYVNMHIVYHHSVL